MIRKLEKGVLRRELATLAPLERCIMRIVGAGLRLADLARGGLGGPAGGVAGGHVGGRSGPDGEEAAAGGRDDGGRGVRGGGGGERRAVVGRGRGALLGAGESEGNAMIG